MKAFNEMHVMSPVPEVNQQEDIALGPLCTSAKPISLNLATGPSLTKQLTQLDPNPEVIPDGTRPPSPPLASRPSAIHPLKHLETITRIKPNQKKSHATHHVSLCQAALHGILMGLPTTISLREC